MKDRKKKSDQRKIREQSRRLRDAMVWLVRGFSLEDPRKSYPGFYLSPQQCYVLSVVNDVGDISPGDVAKRLGLEKSHLTKIVNTLIQYGAIVKHNDEKDRRKLVLVLTEKGRQMYKELDTVSIASYTNFMKQIPEGEREKVIRATEIMLDALNRMGKKKRN
jgi:DNA-binding MarR family transcriptional regulator